MAGGPGETVLVTGANGQIGTELVLALQERYGTDSVIASDLCEPSDLQGPFEICDVLDRGRLEEIVDDHGVTIIYHLAALLSATGEKNPELCERVNIGGLANVLELAKERGCRVYSPSSIAVFGPDCPKRAMQDSPLNPTTTYGATKVTGEDMAKYYWDAHGVDVRGIRYPGLISWKAPPGGGTTDYAVEVFHHALNYGSYTCFVRSETVLPMMYMDDAIRATLELMDAPSDSLGPSRACYNLAGFSFAAGELVAAIGERVEGFECTFKPDVRQKYADSWPNEIDDTVARDDWNWKPEFSMEEMVDEMLANLS